MVYQLSIYTAKPPISVISVQQFIFILVFIQFTVNHFYFYRVLVSQLSFILVPIQL